MGNLRRGIRWAMVPWKPASLAVALIIGFAVPAFLAGSSVLLLRRSADDLAVEAVQPLAGSSGGLIVTGEGTMIGGSAVALRTLLAAEFESIQALGPPSTSGWTDLGSGWMVARRAELPIRGRSPRLITHPDLLDAITVIAEADDVQGGSWISASVAERNNLVPGDTHTITMGGVVFESQIAGIYADLWPEPPEGLDRLPEFLIPRFNRPMNGPNFELIIVEQSTFDASGVRGYLQWAGELVDPPTDARGLDNVIRAYRRLQRRLVADPELSAAAVRFGGIGGADMSLTTALFDASQRLDANVAILQRSSSSVASVGVVIGLLMSAAGAGFMVRRRSGEYRLLAGEGDGFMAFARRAAAQYLPLSVVAGLSGLALALVVFDSDVSHLRDGEIWRWVAASSGLGATVAALTTGALGARILAPDSNAGAKAEAQVIAAAAGIAGAGWFLGDLGEGQGVNALVVVLPLATLIGGTGITLLAFRNLIARSRHRGARLPIPLLLAWRRLGTGGSGAARLAVMAGTAAGLAAFATVMVGSLENASEVRLATEVGAPIRVEVLSTPGPRPLPTPLETTSIFATTTRIAGVQGVTLIQVVDPATYPSVVEWPHEYTGSAADALDRIGSASDAGPSVRVIAVGAGIPDVGGFGREQFGFTVVDRRPALPGIGSFQTTLLTTVEEIDRVAAGRLAVALEVQGVDPSPQVVAEQFRSPTRSMQWHVLSTLDSTDALAEGIRAVLPGAAILNAVDAASLGNSPTQRSEIQAFRYLLILGATGLGCFGVAVLFYLAERRRRQLVAMALTELMGMGRGTQLIATACELILLVFVSASVAIALAIGLAARLVDVFEPLPDRLPAVGLVGVVPTAGAVVAALLVVTLLTGVLTQRSLGRIEKGQVLRGYS